MAKLIMRQAAIDDLTSIWEYTIEKWSPHQADKYYSSIKSACLRLAQESEEGKNYDSIESQLLGYQVGRHIIFYKLVQTGDLEVIRILHVQMDLKNRLKGRT